MRQFRSTLDFDPVMGMLEAFSLEPFAVNTLDSADFTLSFEPVTFTPEDFADGPYSPYDDDDERGLRSQTVGIQYAGQLVGSFIVREQGDKTIAAVTVCDAPGAPRECRPFILAWFRAFWDRLAQLSAPPAVAPAAHHMEYALGPSDEGPDGVGDGVVPASAISDDYLAIIDALWQGHVEPPAGPSADPYVKYYYLKTLLELGRNIPSPQQTTWKRVAAIYEQNNPRESAFTAVDPARNMAEKWKKSFDERHPVFCATLNRLRKLERSA